jgi:hypothetical protein
MRKTDAKISTDFNLSKGLCDNTHKNMAVE